MLKIGDFSKLSRISIRMLRHYDEMELLKPEKVDPFTGYRYYGESQLLMAGRIQCLKNMGFSLSEISGLLEQYQDAGEMERFLLEKRQEMEQQAEEIRQKIRLIDSTIRWLRKDGEMRGYDVTLKTMPERYVASVRKVIPTYADEGELWHLLRRETYALHMQDGNPLVTTALFYDGDFNERDVDVEVQMSVHGTYQDTEHVRFKTVPAVQTASATYKGVYDQLSEVNEAVARWICDNGYEMDGLAFNIYHVSPRDTENPDEYVTEVCYPVRKIR